MRWTCACRSINHPLPCDRVALREIAEAKEPDKYAIAMLRSCTAGVSAQSVRKTPEGAFCFSVFMLSGTITMDVDLSMLAYLVHLPVYAGSLSLNRFFV